MNESAPSLPELQTALLRYLLHGERGIAAHVRDAAGESALTRLAIYGEAYRLRLVEVLGSDYGTLQAVLGAQAFQQLGRAYAGACPSRFRSVRWFGGGLADFMASHSPWREQADLVELARFEWALSLAFDAADVATVELGVMAGIGPEDWPGMRFAFHPSLARLDLHGNAPRRRRAFDAGEPVPAAERHAAPTAWLVWRSDGVSRYRSMTVDEAWALDAALQGMAFGDLCGGLLEWLDAEHVALHAAGLLKTWIADGLLTGVRLDGDA